MTKYPIFHRWIPEENPPTLQDFSAQLEGRLQEIDALLDVKQEEDDDIANIPLPSDPGQPANPIVISDDEEPFATIEELLKNSAEEDNVEASAVTAPPSSSAGPMEVAEDTLEEAMDSVNDLSNDDLQDALHHAEENVVEDSMNNSTEALQEAVEHVFEEVIENVLEEAIEDALDDAEDKAAQEAIGVVQEVSENVEAVDEDPANEMVQETSQNIEVVDEASAISEAAQEILEDPGAVEGGPQIEDPFLPEVDLEGEEFIPLAASAAKSSSAEAPIPFGVSPPHQEKLELEIWTAIFHPASKRPIFNLRFRSDLGHHLRHTPVEDRPEEYIWWSWPLSAQIPTGIFYLILYIKS